ncbi:MAG: rhomboid family intramembrane serine protease [Bacteroidota bacterium]|nr:rhomboid family intramembrane serine protease [Bacteroidota bacterium]
MLRSIIDDIRYQFQTGNTITRLIIVNVSIFLALILLKLILMLTGGPDQHGGLFSRITDYIFLSQDLLWDAKHPWTLFTHMFTHVGLFHMIFNMLVLYWFGRIAGDLLGDHRMLPLYLFSGLAGALVYLISAPLFYEQSTLHGASGAIMGIVAAAGMTAPDYQMRLLFFGDVRLKYIVFGLLVIYLVSLAGLDNAGGQMAHFGGAAFGFFYVHMLRQGRDLTVGFRRMQSFFSKPKKRPSPAMKRRVPLEVRHRSISKQREAQTGPSAAYPGDQERLDSILDKIKQTGFDSLNEEEKKFLHDASQK